MPAKIIKSEIENGVYKGNSSWGDWQYSWNTAKEFTKQLPLDPILKIPIPRFISCYKVTLDVQKGDLSKNYTFYKTAK